MQVCQAKLDAALLALCGIKNNAPCYVSPELAIVTCDLQ